MGDEGSSSPGTMGTQFRDGGKGDAYAQKEVHPAVGELQVGPRRALLGQAAQIRHAMTQVRRLSRYGLSGEGWGRCGVLGGLCASQAGERGTAISDRMWLKRVNTPANHDKYLI